MYQNPELNRVGDAEEVILGVASIGDDIDTNFISNPFEFAPENDPDEE